MHLIIPMSGIGSRFQQQNYKDPKPLIPIENKPMIEHVLNMFPTLPTTFICNENHLKTTNMKQILQTLRPNSTIISIPEHKKGPVYALQQAFNQIQIDDDIIVSYCDFSSTFNYNEFLKKTENYDGIIFVYKGFHPHMLGTDNYAFIKLNNQNEFEQIQEKKPFTNNRMNEYASNGIYYFKKGILPNLCNQLIEKNIHVNNEYYVSMLYNLIQKEKVSVFEIEFMLQWGTPKDLEEYLFWSNYFLHTNQKQANIYFENTTLILPMAGAGSRFSIKGYSLPKPLLPINNEPMIIQAVKQIPQCSKNYFICLSDQLPIIQNDLLKFSLNTEILPIDKVTEGQACTVNLCIEHFEKTISPEDSILISACDNGIQFNQNSLNNIIQNEDFDVLVFTFKDHITSKRFPHMYSWILHEKENSENNLVKEVCVKFKKENCQECIIGTMLFKKCKYFTENYHKIVEKNIRTNNEFYVDNVLNECILQGLKVKTFCVDYYLCWGTPDDYETYTYWEKYFNKYHLKKLVNN